MWLQQHPAIDWIGCCLSLSKNASNTYEYGHPFVTLPPICDKYALKAPSAQESRMYQMLSKAVIPYPFHPFRTFSRHSLVFRLGLMKSRYCAGGSANPAPRLLPSGNTILRGIWSFNSGWSHARTVPARFMVSFLLIN